MTKITHIRSKDGSAESKSQYHIHTYIHTYIYVYILVIVEISYTAETNYHEFTQ